MRKSTAEKCNLNSNLQLMKISDDRFILYSKLKAIDDGISSLKLVPDNFSSSKLKALNQDLDNTFFTENLFTEELQASILPLEAKPKFYVICVSVSTLEQESIGNLLYNVKVDLST
jgi:hypothetical protein